VAVRVGGAADAVLLGEMLHAFNAEYGEHEPSAATVAALAGPQLESGEVAVLFTEDLVDDRPAGFAQLRLHRSLYSPGQDATLEELWVRPAARGRGLGRELLESAMAHARRLGATRIELNTSTDDVAARALYASAGFTNEEGGPGGPSMLYYERDL
jgi:ribosomal protein S18 acetylase RimI-like enzyme